MGSTPRARLAAAAGDARVRIGPQPGLDAHAAQSARRLRPLAVPGFHRHHAGAVFRQRAGPVFRRCAGHVAPGLHRRRSRDRGADRDARGAGHLARFAERPRPGGVRRPGARAGAYAERHFDQDARPHRPAGDQHREAVRCRAADGAEPCAAGGRPRGARHWETGNLRSVRRQDPRPQAGPGRYSRSHGRSYRLPAQHLARPVPPG